MATIALYKSKINAMPNLVSGIKASILSAKVELFNLGLKMASVDTAICNLEETTSEIRAATELMEGRAEKLEQFRSKVEDFIELTVDTDQDAAETVNQNKDDFYDKYDYLKPDCEKSGWEKFCDGLEAVASWCKKHWKLIVTIVIVAVAIVLLVVPGVGPILSAAAMGALIGAASGGLMGGLSSAMNGGSFWEGFEEGAFSGAITGAITGALGGAGSMLGSSCKFAATAVGRIFNAAMPTVFKISTAISLSMGGFDLLSFGLSFIDADNPITRLNQQLHSSKLYNGFQFGVGMLAAFSGGFTKGMQNQTCFVAGTLVLTANGLMAIENIRVGDKVIATDPETFETSEKKVTEAFARKVNFLIHLVVGGEEIITTPNHPFYVKDRGFVNAGELLIGDCLISLSKNEAFVERYQTEITETPIDVYNIKVEDYHTYYVGCNRIFVHNANCRLIENSDGSYDAELSYKDDWTPEQRAEADSKCKILSEADTRKTDVSGKRNPYNTSRFRKNQAISSSQDVDHMVDLQLNGKDIPSNMWGLDKSVNRSLGTQINSLIKNLPEGTILKNFIMK